MRENSRGRSSRPRTAQIAIKPDLIRPMKTKTTQVFLLFSLLMFLTAGCSGDPPSIQDETDRVNYAIGHQIGRDFKQQNIALEEASFLRGINHGHAVTKPEVAAPEMQRLLSGLKRDITEDMKTAVVERLQKKQRAVKKKREQGQEFLEQNKARENIVTTASGLQYKVIREGQGAVPGKTDRVRLRYRGRRINGQEFARAFHQGQPRVFSVRELMPGLSEAVQRMHKGGKWEIYIPPELAFGRQGPLAHEVLIVEVELLEIQTPVTTKQGPENQQTDPS